MNKYNLNVSNDDGSGQVGIWFIDDSLKIIFPKNYTYDYTNLYDDIKILSNCLDKYSKIQSQNNINFNVLKDDSIHGQKEFSFMSYFNILDKYIEYGYYHETIECHQVNGKGNINFIKTINKYTPFVVSDNCLFIDHITKSKKRNLDNTLTDIHKYVVEQCFKIIGAFYPKIDYEQNCYLPFSTEYCINFLQQTILETFNDDKRLFFEMLMSFFKIKKVSDTNITFYSTNKFENIWEVMLRYLLGNIDVSNFYFKSTWHLLDNKRTNSPSRPDIVNVNYNPQLTKTYIIDAKYFTYTLSNPNGTLPGTSDINKQILYKNHIENIIPKQYISEDYIYVNCFILPCDSLNCKIEYLGYATSDFNINEKVYAFSLDIKYVMKNYININNKTSISKSILDYIYNNI